MSTIASARRARTAALIAAALAALGCSEGAPLTGPRRATPASSASPASASATQSTLAPQGSRLSGYALASGRITDTIPAPAGK